MIGAGLHLRWTVGLCLAMMPFLAASQTASSTIESVDIVRPRSFGYTIGDSISHDISLTLTKPSELVRDSLPRGGRLNRWLELEPPQLRTHRQGNATVYDIRFTYHIRYVEPSMQTVVIEGYELSVAVNGQTLPVFIPAWSFTAAPVTPPLDISAKGFLDLRPDRAPRIATGTFLWKTVFFATTLVAALGYLSHVFWGFPLGTQTARPFTVGLRHLKRLQKQPFDRVLYERALRRFHTAFNHTFNGVLFARNLDGFFLRCPEFDLLRQPIAAFFEHSSQVFFDPEKTHPVTPGALDELIDLCLRCRDCERAL